jgi:hypothetical protein
VAMHFDVSCRTGRASIILRHRIGEARCAVTAPILPNRLPWPRSPTASIIELLVVSVSALHSLVVPCQWWPHHRREIP